MAGPVVKRRKLSHTPSGSDSDHDESDIEMLSDGAAQEEDSEEDGASTAEELDSEAGGDSGEDGPDSSNNEKTAKAKDGAVGKAAHARKPQQRSHDGAQNGAYTAEVYKSNVFKLQVDDLLSQVRLKYGKKEAPAESALRTLKAIIEKIPSQSPLSISDAEKSLKSSKVAIPFPHPKPPKDAMYKLSYEKPSNISVMGSYPLKIATRTDDELAIDLVVTLPSTLFQEKDFLNHRYFYKRAFYLAHIASGIKSSKGHSFQLSYDYLHQNHLLPIIVVRGNAGGSKDDFSSSKCKIHIIPAIPEGIFPLEKTLPDKNCVRPKAEDDAALAKPSPTPFYNASLRTDSSVVSYLKLMHNALNECEAFKDTCILGRVWLRQRGFSGDIRKGGFGNFEWAAIVALLLQNSGAPGVPMLSNGYSSYQLFKSTLQFLASRKLVRSPLLLKAQNFDIPKSQHTPVLFDGERGLNILYKMTPWSYGVIQAEAATTVKMLGDTTFDQFEPTFILRSDPPLYRYDCVVEISLASLDFDAKADDYDTKLKEYARKTYTVLSRGLGDRACLISVELPEGRAWGLEKPQPQEHRDAKMIIGIVVDPANALRAVDHGPSAEEKKDAAVFRQFWGEKAELRRFKDGSILESLVWSSKDPNISVVEQIVRYLVWRHLKKEAAESLTFVGTQFHRLLPGSAQFQPGTAAFAPIMNAFKQMEKDIREVEGMPLTVRFVQAACPQLRYSSVELPTTATKTIMSQPADVVLQFEGSARWPDHVVAIQRTKVAFLMRLGELLEESVDGITCRVGLENQGHELLNQTFLDIIYPTGFAFRLRIHHDREVTLLERNLKDKELEAQQREESALALATHRRMYLRAPAHTQAIQNLSTRHPMFSPTIRLVKKWFDSHLLSSHFSPEFIELLVARTFTQPYPWQPPSSPTSGFLRTIFFISRWDWRAEPLIVDFGDEMKTDGLKAIQTRFEAWRNIDPARHRLVIFAASNVDPEGSTWTDHQRPPQVAATRMTSLARAACEHIKSEGINVDPASLFVSPLTDYEFLIHLNPKHTRAAKEKGKGASNAQFKNLQLQAAAVKDLHNVGYDALDLFVEDLQRMYALSCVFFCDRRGGNVIAGIWNPNATAKRNWKVKLGYSSVPVKAKENNEGKQEVDVVVNKDGILSEIARLGGEMVKRVEVVGK